MTGESPFRKDLKTGVWRTSRFATMILLTLFNLLAACSPNFHNLRRMVEPVDMVSMQRRLQDVALPLLVAASESCPFEQESTYGFFLYDETAKKGSQSALNQSADRKAVVAYVHPQLGAASAGLVVGDRVVVVNAKSVEGESADMIMRMVRSLTKARIQPLQLVVKRGEEPHTVTIWAVPACQFSLQLIDSEIINGVSNGRQVGVTTGAMRMFFWDDELAWILSHEIAHNILSHVQNAKLRTMLGTFLGATLGASSPVANAPEPRSLEAQADYVGAYLMARTGFDLDAIRRVWNRLREIELRQAQWGQAMAHTHPTTVERLAAFDETLKEIDAKRRRGEPMRPRLEPAP